MQREAIDLPKARVPIVSEEVFQQLRLAIIEGRLAPGTRLVELDIADRLGVSKTPVREALLRLERLGLVVARPRRGSFVADVDSAQVEAMLMLRELIEGHVAEQACRRMTPAQATELYALAAAIPESYDQPAQISAADIALHDQIYRLGGNTLLYQVWQLIRERLAIWHMWGYSRLRLFEEIPSIRGWHVELVDAITSGNPDRAREAAYAHIRRARQAIGQAGQAEGPSLPDEAPPPTSAS